MAFHTAQQKRKDWDLFADASQSDFEDEDEESQSEFEDEEDCSETTSVSSCNDSPMASFGGSTTTGISSMDNSEHLRAVSSNCTLDDLFHEQLSQSGEGMETKHELDIDEGHVSDAERQLDVDVNFVINLNNQALATPQELTTPTTTIETPLQQNYAPLKHFLQPVCTIGTGTFTHIYQTLITSSVLQEHSDELN